MKAASSFLGADLSWDEADDDVLLAAQVASVMYWHRFDYKSHYVSTCLAAPMEEIIHWLPWKLSRQASLSIVRVCWNRLIMQGRFRGRAVKSSQLKMDVTDFVARGYFIFPAVPYRLTNHAVNALDLSEQVLPAPEEGSLASLACLMESAIKTAHALYILQHPDEGAFPPLDSQDVIELMYGEHISNHEIDFYFEAALGLLQMEGRVLQNIYGTFVFHPALVERPRMAALTAP